MRKFKEYVEFHIAAHITDSIGQRAAMNYYGVPSLSRVIVVLAVVVSSLGFIS